MLSAVFITLGKRHRGMLLPRTTPHGRRRGGDGWCRSEMSVRLITMFPCIVLFDRFENGLDLFGAELENLEQSDIPSNSGSYYKLDDFYRRNVVVHVRECYEGLTRVREINRVRFDDRDYEFNHNFCVGLLRRTRDMLQERMERWKEFYDRLVVYYNAAEHWLLAQPPLPPRPWAPLASPPSSPGAAGIGTRLDLLYL